MGLGRQMLALVALVPLVASCAEPVTGLDDTTPAGTMATPVAGTDPPPPAGTAPAPSTDPVCYPNGGTADGERGDSILIAPPFIVEQDDLDQNVSRLGDAIDAAVESVWGEKGS